ncbi:hypothetical protein N8500_03850 [Candidatus Puniceispirillum sp.]|nr:hypothetical protein [Candidatus Puniceispirillum sp.]
MENFTQIGALVEKNLGLEAYHTLSNSNGVVYAFLETGRSSDLFSEKQFGEFGEAAILTVVVESKQKDALITNMAKSLNLVNGTQGLVFEEAQLLKCS